MASLTCPSPFLSPSLSCNDISIPLPPQVLKRVNEIPFGSDFVRTVTVNSAGRTYVAGEGLVIG